MHRIAISLLSIFVVFPAVAGVALPVVNIASGGVSARDAFGEGVKNTSVKTSRHAVSNDAKTRTRRVVARSATPVKSVPVAPAKQDVVSGESIVAHADVLSPRRPRADLWAKSDNALRMPMPNEFSVIRNDDLLPEENIDTVSLASVKPVAKPVVSDDVDTTPVKPSELDTQIARLVEMQKRADASVRTVTPRIATVQNDDLENSRVSVSDKVPETVADVSLRRLVVPMDDDVVVRSVEKNKSPRIVAVRDDMTKMSPSQLRQAFRKTFLSENKHLSTYSIDDSYDVASDMSTSIQGFTAKSDLSEGTGIRPLEIKIKFRNDDSALSRENYNLLTEYAGIVVNKPTRAIQVAIPQYMTQTTDGRKLAARRLAIVEQVLTDNGVSQQRIVPVLSQREESGFVLRIISGDQYETLTQQQRNIFGDTVGKKTYKSMTW